MQNYVNKEPSVGSVLCNISSDYVKYLQHFDFYDFFPVLDIKRRKTKE